MDDTYREKELILRDYLAIDRTLLANERTFLSYIRTAVTVFIAALSLIKFFENPILEFLGWILLFIAIWVTFRGFIRQWQVQKFVNTHYKHIPVKPNFIFSTFLSIEKYLESLFSLVKPVKIVEDNEVKV